MLYSFSYFCFAIAENNLFYLNSLAVCTAWFAKKIVIFSSDNLSVIINAFYACRIVNEKVLQLI